MYLMYEFNNLHLEILTRRCWSFRLANENLIQCSLLKINGFRLLNPKKLEGQMCIDLFLVSVTMQMLLLCMDI